MKGVASYGTNYVRAKLPFDVFTFLFHFKYAGLKYPNEYVHVRMKCCSCTVAFKSVLEQIARTMLSAHSM